MIMNKETNIPDRHLTEPELFSLALPASGEPEALPAHLSECLSCSRVLQQWKGAVRDLAAEDEEVLGRRTAARWEALEDQTIAAIRRARSGASRKRVQWALSIAASLVLAVFLLPALRPAGSAAPASASAFSAEDARDEALLLEVDRLASGEDAGSWYTLAPEPADMAEEKL